LLQGEIQDGTGGRAPHPEIDPPRGQRLQLLEHLRYLERAVMVEQHATGTESDPRGAHRCGSDEELRVVRGTRAAQVVLGEPDPVEPEALGMLNAFQRL